MPDLHSQSQDVAESASAAVDCREPPLEDKSYQLSRRASFDMGLNFMTRICSLTALGEKRSRHCRSVRFTRNKVITAKWAFSWLLCGLTLCTVNLPAIPIG